MRVPQVRERRGAWRSPCAHAGVFSAVGVFRGATVAGRRRWSTSPTPRTWTASAGWASARSRPLGGPPRTFTLLRGASPTRGRPSVRCRGGAGTRRSQRSRARAHRPRRAVDSDARPRCWAWTPADARRPTARRSCAGWARTATGFQTPWRRGAPPRSWSATRRSPIAANCRHARYQARGAASRTCSSTPARRGSAAGHHSPRWTAALADGGHRGNEQK